VFQAARIPSIEGRAKPPEGYETWDAYMLHVEAEARAEANLLRERPDLTPTVWGADKRDPRSNINRNRDPLIDRRISKAMRLSGGRLDVFEALLAGEQVPDEVMDQEWLRRYA
jgi:hypothetical protein